MFLLENKICKLINIKDSDYIRIIFPSICQVPFNFSFQSYKKKLTGRIHTDCWAKKKYVIEFER